MLSPRSITATGTRKSFTTTSRILDFLQARYQHCHCENSDEAVGDSILCGRARLRSTNLVSRLVAARIRTVDLAIPTKIIEALCANLWNRRLCSFQAPLQNRTSYTHGPRRICRSITHSSHVVAVLHNQIALAGIVAGVKGRDIALIAVWGIGYVHDQRCRRRSV